jgi:hypothetical protein
MNTGSIKAKRESAARARRLARGLANPEDNARLLAFADELSEQADALEREDQPEEPPKNNGAAKPN